MGLSAFLLNQAGRRSMHRSHTAPARIPLEKRASTAGEANDTARETPCLRFTKRTGRVANREMAQRWSQGPLPPPALLRSTASSRMVVRSDHVTNLHRR